MILSALVVAFGLIIGSFLNVVIHRLPLDGQSIVKPGSHCPGCKTPIPWYSNIPLVSYLALRGKCASCKTPIHWRYPLVEFLCAFLFWYSFRSLPMSVFAVISQIRIWVFIAICIAVTFIDLDHRIIPHELSLGGWAFGALTAYWDFRSGMGGLLAASIAGFGFFFLFGLAYEKITGRVGLGGGDVNFMGTIGVFLGFGGLWSAIMISSIVGTVVGLAVAKFKNSGEGLKTSIPYGPFLVLGALVELFYEVSRWIVR